MPPKKEYSEDLPLSPELEELVDTFAVVDAAV